MSGLLDGLKKIGAAAQTIGKLASPPAPKLERQYTVEMTLTVKAQNKKALEEVIKNLRAKFDKVGTDIVGKALGVGDAVQLVDIDVQIGKSE